MKRILRLGALVLLTLAALEVGLRAAGFARVPSMWFDPDVGYRFYPDQSRRMVHQGEEIAAVEINSLGFRGPAYAEPKGPGVVRILFLGDSYTFGVGVDDDQSCPVTLEALLREQHGAGSVEVTNLGFPGYNTENELASYRKLGRPFEPDVVVLGYAIDDVQPTEPGHPHTHSLPFRLLGRTALLDAFNRHLRWRFDLFTIELTDEEREFIRTYKKDPLRVQMNAGTPFTTPYWDRTLTAVDDLARDVAADGGRLVVAFFPSGHQVRRLRRARDQEPAAYETLVAEQTKAQRFVAEHVTEIEATFVNLLEDFVGSLENPMGRKALGHPGPVGYRVSAERLARVLTDLGVF